MTELPPYKFYDPFRTPPPPALPPVAPVTNPAGGGRYAVAALDAEIATLRATGEGRRNDQLNISGFKLFTLVATGALDEQLVETELTSAGLAIGLPAHEIAATISSAKNGLNHPRDIPELAATATVPPVNVLTPTTGGDEAVGLRLVLTPASAIKPLPVRWFWEGRLALGTLGLLAGDVGLGKSTLSYWMAARASRGELPGEYLGQPKAVLVCAAEDSWAHTIVPRLIAAGADLDKVLRVEVVTADDITTGLSLPRDLLDVEKASRESDAALMILDPLMSRLAETLDTHRDGDVRRALEPLVTVAERTGMATLGLIHHNKSGSNDPLQLVMASKAFTAVARSVHSVIRDPDDESETRRLFGTPKNNLGRENLATLAFVITSHHIDTDDGPASTGKLEWVGEVDGTIADAIRRGVDDDRSATSEAADWLEDYLTEHGGTAASADIKRDGAKAGHSYDALKRARQRLHSPVTSAGFPRCTWWSLPGTQSTVQLEQQSEQQSAQTPRGDTLTALTAPTGHTDPQSEQSEQSEHVSKTGAPTDAPTGNAS